MKPRRRPKKTTRGNSSPWLARVSAAAVVLSLTAYGALMLDRDVPGPTSVQLAGKTIDRANVHERTAEFISYNNSVALTADQRRVMDEALSAIPAPCCSEFSIATCCCPCNLAKSVWGLTKFLITREHAGVSEITTAVNDWIQFTNPAGYTGDACTKGHCDRPFDNNGCGGMNERRIL